MEAIGILESNSIARGVNMTDALLKTADVTLVYGKPVCPGKYTALFYGDVAAVTASCQAGEAVAGGSLVDSVVIPRVHPQVIKAINMSAEPVNCGAVGIMEFYSITAAVYAADAAVKASQIDLIEVRLGLGIGGKSFVALTGEVAAVKAAVDAGMSTASDKGLCVDSVVIPNPRKEVFESLL